MGDELVAEAKKLTVENRQDFRKLQSQISAIILLHYLRELVLEPIKRRWYNRYRLSMPILYF